MIRYRRLGKLFLLIGVMASVYGCAPSPRYANLQAGRTAKNRTDNKKTTKSTSGHHSMRGEASWYGPGFHGKTTANGERFNKREMTAAHKTLPFNTVVEVSCPSTGKKVRVRINDRGPYAAGRIIDLSERAAEKLGIKDKGHAPVVVRIIK